MPSQLETIRSTRRPTTAPVLRPGAARAAVDTELDLVVADLPWQKGFAFGAGIDAVTGAQSGTAVQAFVPTPHGPKSSEHHYRWIQSTQDVAREAEASASGKYNIEGITVSGSAAYLQKLRVSELAVTLVAEYVVRYDRYDEADTNRLTPEAQRMLPDPPAFRKAFGDYFVAGGCRESRFLAVYACQATSVEQMDSFKASFSGSAPQVLTAEGSARFEEAVSRSNVSVSLDLFMSGYEGTPPSGPWTPEGVLKALEWFVANEKGAYALAKLKHYTTLAPDYPRTIPIAPSVFAQLRSLYLKLWQIRAMYGSAPPSYQRRFRDEFNALDSGLVAHQGDLASDPEALGGYEQKADALMGKLQDMADRWDFYLKVKARTWDEPPQGQEIEETASGPQAWLYGFNGYSKSPAVVIQSETRRYAEEWHVGWREATLETGPDSRRLLVGWQVNSNWGDGSNGSWWKAVDRILLTGHGAVHVKSRYDRGCDWTVIYYWVDAADYDF
jgi:hypothetical protein